MPRSAAPAEPSSHRRRRLIRWGVPLLFGLVCMVVFNANLRTIAAGDSFSARYLPLMMLGEQTTTLDGHERLLSRGHPLDPPPAQTAQPGDVDYVTYFTPYSYWIFQSRHTGHTLSMYPAVTPLVATPLFYPAYRYLQQHGWGQPQLDRVSELAEKFAASLIAAIAAVLMYVLLRRERIKWALPLAAAFAFGTNTWAVSSQALWQHGVGELLVVLALLLALGRSSPSRLAALGLVCALMAANRPPDAAIAAAFGAYVVWRNWRHTGWLLAGAALPVAALLAYNVALTGNVLGGYPEAAAARGDLGKATDGFLRTDWLGPLGMLVSPGRGLLVFTPFLIFVPIGLALRLKNPATKRLAIALTLGIALQLLVYSQTDWRAGAAWGPRWLTDILPILVWMLAPAVAVLRPRGRAVLAATMAASVAIQVVGAFWYTGESDDRILAAGTTSPAAAWKPANLPYLVELRHKPASAELLCEARGSVDRVGATIITGDGTVPELTPGAAIEGWGLTCNRSPAQILVLVDGIIVGHAEAFTPRPDVDQVFGTTAKSGWHVDANTRGLKPGRHVLQLAARIDRRSDPRIVRELEVDVPKAAAGPTGNELPALATRAAQQLKERQRPGGDWLTTFTAAPRYREPADELNTFTPALIVDLLAPLAKDAGLTPQLQRTRGFLARQIEPSGLVRYHGLPDAPGIGTLGCAITPDSDDTALTWRIAGRGKADARHRRMLATLARYRTPQGLYRTWLAPQANFECIDPGRDPNPADLVNQMHIWLLLRELDPPAAKELCSAIQRAAADPKALAYYVKSPLILYLRSAELSGLGCRLPLPEPRLASAAPGQEPWTELVTKLVATLDRRPSPELRAAIKTLLVNLGSDDFTLLARTPPLLYSNDPTATVSRFYWSEDVGYALWLRLYAVVKEPAR